MCVQCVFGPLDAKESGLCATQNSQTVIDNVQRCAQVSSGHGCEIFIPVKACRKLVLVKKNTVKKWHTGPINVRHVPSLGSLWTEFDLFEKLGLKKKPHWIHPMSSLPRKLPPSAFLHTFAVCVCGKGGIFYEKHWSTVPPGSVCSGSHRHADC